MTRKLARVVTVVGLAAAMTFTPTMAFAQTVRSAAVKCLVTIDTPWGEFCLIPDVFT